VRRDEMKKDILQQIIAFGEDNKQILAMVLNGSRVNPNAPVDAYQDYDVACYVDDPQAFVKDQTWIKQFGELIIMQQNPSKGEKLLYSDDYNGTVIFLMLFQEGFRIDMCFTPVEQIHQKLEEDSLSLILIDKDGRVKQKVVPSEANYKVIRPNADVFDFITNEFWWCMTNVAKGLARNEMVYAKSMLEMVIRKAFHQMVDWYIGVNHKWDVNPGKFGKWYANYLTEEEYQILLSTYTGSNINEMWDSLFVMCDFFQKMSHYLANKCDFMYEFEEEERVIIYLRAVRDASSN
jgi:aminoglycoside 6-adenylyltransferase